MSNIRRQRGALPSAKLSERVRDLIDAHGTPAAAERLGLSRDAVVSLAAGLYVLPGTIALAERKLAEHPEGGSVNPAETSDTPTRARETAAPDWQKVARAVVASRLADAEELREQGDPAQAAEVEAHACDLLVEAIEADR